MPEMQLVSSSNIESVGFDINTAELHIRFSKTGKTYVYRGVGESVFLELLSAPSVGTYFSQNIKNVYVDFYIL